METLTNELVSNLRAEIAILRHSHESLKEQNERMREALEWLKHHISQASIDKSVIKGIVEAALKS